ncbi:type I restriction enzyme S subunit [Lachnotalea glycerini]|uniref:Type I restriction enzyme S subunit n=1 Tax=Lachnotalea glycerini TaxID=1763509 RepID=A0A318EU27_9FIRM|nr:restriction endonuclease subunit S [Lachnotalea glycerini]PXV91700.1 type I restriction enzyme S subunit [Lachnotalea glycerini]
MREDIKERIEMIKRGEVPEGYIETKAGIVPITWEKQYFRNLFKEKKRMTNELNKYPLYSLTLEKGIVEKSDRYDREHLVKKDEDVYKIVEKNDFAYNPMNIRFGAVARNKTDKAVCVSGYYDIFEVANTEDMKYMDDYLVSYPMIKYFNRVCTGSLDEKKRVHFSQFLDFNLPMPMLSERKEISQTLSAFNRKIQLQERLIANKNEQKKYIMKNLLSGKKRLPEFNLEWKTKKMSCFFTERSESNAINCELLSITGSGIIPRSEIEGKDNSSEDKSKYKKIYVGDIGYNTMRMWQGVSAYSQHEGIVSPAYTILKAKDNADAKFFSYLFKVPSIIFLFYRYSQGLVDDTRNLKFENFRKIKINVPLDIEEQKAIAKILSQADKEIELLEQQLEILKLEKKAMMQLLLSGIVRAN